MQITTAEVEFVEVAVYDLSANITGEVDVPESIWGRSRPFCNRIERQYKDYWDQEAEYWRCFLLWINQTEAYLTYLEAYQGEPEVSDHTSYFQDQHAMKHQNVAYDVAISFAGQDRATAKAIADGVRSRGFRVFYDEYEAATLWGRDLYVHLSDVYRNRAKFCLMLLSQYYRSKLWTNHERRAAQARAFKENSDYILPLRLDDAEIDGILPTTGYIDIRTHPVAEVVDLLCQKLTQQAQQGTQPNREQDGELGQS